MKQGRSELKFGLSPCWLRLKFATLFRSAAWISTKKPKPMQGLLEQHTNYCSYHLFLTGQHPAHRSYTISSTVKMVYPTAQRP